MNTKQKGNNFERDCSRMLSLWWTGGKRDDAIWRSASSGALTTVGKGRYLAHTGDFAATDGEAELLFKHVIIEAKRGYNRYSMQDLVDVPVGRVSQNPVHEMLIKLVDSCKTQGKLGMLLWKKDRRDLIVILTDYAAYPGHAEPVLSVNNFLGYRVCVLPWQSFCKDTKGSELKELLRRHDLIVDPFNVSAIPIKSLRVPPVASSSCSPSTPS